MFWTDDKREIRRRKLYRDQQLRRRKMYEDSVRLYKKLRYIDSVNRFLDAYVNGRLKLCRDRYGRLYYKDVIKVLPKGSMQAQMNRMNAYSKAAEGAKPSASPSMASIMQQNASKPAVAAPKSNSPSMASIMQQQGTKKPVKPAMLPNGSKGGSMGAKLKAFARNHPTASKVGAGVGLAALSAGAGAGTGAIAGNIAGEKHGGLAGAITGGVFGGFPGAVAGYYAGKASGSRSEAAKKGWQTRKRNGTDKNIFGRNG